MYICRSIHTLHTYIYIIITCVYIYTYNYIYHHLVGIPQQAGTPLKWGRPPRQGHNDTPRPRLNRRGSQRFPAAVLRTLPWRTHLMEIIMDFYGVLWCFMVIYGDLMGFYGGNNGFL